MRLDVRDHPALLKLDLYCRGLQLDDSVLLAAEGSRPVLRTRAGLGSGLELVLPGGHWTNVPVTEAFARRSPYVLRKDRRGLAIKEEKACEMGWQESLAYPVSVPCRGVWFSCAWSLYLSGSAGGNLNLLATFAVPEFSSVVEIPCTLHLDGFARIIFKF